MRKVTTGDAPTFINLNDKAFWVLGYNAAIRDMEQEARLQSIAAPYDGKILTEAEAQAAIDKLKAQLPLVPEQLRDPCPGCRPGTACRTPNCGRLKLPPNHPHAYHTHAKDPERCKHGVWLSDHCYSCELEDKKPCKDY